MNELEKRKLLSVLCHASPFLSFLVLSVAVPIVIMATTDDSVVKANAKESLNFFINLFIYGIIAFVLTFVLIGFLMYIILFAVSVILPIIAVIKVINNPEEPYRYPFIFRLV
jgi:uncharacterized protein